jgi:hypothetical protein
VTHIPHVATDLAGFALAHALWNVCDIEDPDEVLCPLAFTLDGRQRELLRFEADSQEEAIDAAHAHLAEDSTLIAWAFAREAIMRTPTGPVDVVLVEAWSDELDEPVVFAQPFAPANAGEFALLDVPLVLVDGKALPEDLAAPVLDRLRAGALSHDEAAARWDAWQGW